MKRFLTTTLTTVFCGGYTAWCLILGLSALSAIYTGPNAVYTVVLIDLFVTSAFISFLLKQRSRAELKQKIFMAVMILTLLGIGLWIPWTPENIKLMVITGSLLAAVRTLYTQTKKPSP